MIENGMSASVSKSDEYKLLEEGKQLFIVRSAVDFKAGSDKIIVIEVDETGLISTGNTLVLQVVGIYYGKGKVIDESLMILSVKRDVQAEIEMKVRVAVKWYEKLKRIVNKVIKKRRNKKAK